MSSEFIEDYRFGRIVIEGETYTDDLILLGKEVKPKWWRKRGHSLSEDDLQDVIDFKPDLLIVGTGSSGNMSVPSTLPERLDFKVVSYPTKEAIKRYNRKILKNDNIAGAFHLTC